MVTEAPGSVQSGLRHQSPGLLEELEGQGSASVLRCHTRFGRTPSSPDGAPAFGAYVASKFGDEVPEDV